MANSVTQAGTGTDFTKPCTVKELARSCRVHRNTMGKLLRSGKIRSQRVGHLWCALLADLPHLRDGSSSDQD